MGKIIYKGVGYGGGGNSNTGDFVDVDQILSSGTKIATININNEPNDIYAPGGVSDVTVNGVSVLNSNYVAVIDLTSYATQTDLASKQDTLTPGTNITISNNVISAAGGTDVEANPQGAATADLTKIGIDNVIYNLAGGGGSGDLTAVELTKAQYDALTQAQKEDTTKLYMVTDYSPGGGGSGDLEDLGDVNITSPTNGQVLTYDSASQKWINAAGGGGSSSAQKVDIFNGASTITLTQSNGITVSTSSVSNMVGSINGSEWSNGYEGFNIALTNLTVGDNYILNFDFQFNNTVWFGGYRTGYALFATDKYDYDNYGDWQENLQRDTNSHGHREQFTATATTMYLSFNLCGCEDSQTNYWSISNLYVETIGSGIHYSTTEQLIGTWIDGRKIYQRTLYFPNPISGDVAMDFPIGISDSEMDYIISRESIAERWNGDTFYDYAIDDASPVNQWVGGSFMIYGFNKIDGIWNASLSNGYYTIKNLYLTIRYVKPSS